MSGLALLPTNLRKWFCRTLGGNEGYPSKPVVLGVDNGLANNGSYTPLTTPF